MRALVFLTWVCLILVGCGPSSEQIQKYIAETQSAIPTATAIPSSTPEPTSTSIPLSKFDIEAIAFKDGDLPNNAKLGQITDKLREEFASIPRPVNIMVRKIQLGTYAGDGVAIMLYDDFLIRDKAFLAVKQYIEKESKKTDENIQIGEKGIIGIDDALGIPSIKIAIERCGAVVYIDIFGYSADEIAPNYAERLDARLSEKICR